MGLELCLQEWFSPGERREDLEGKRSKAGKGTGRDRVWDHIDHI